MESTTRTAGGTIIELGKARCIEGAEVAVIEAAYAYNAARAYDEACEGWYKPEEYMNGRTRTLADAEKRLAAAIDALGLPPAENDSRVG